LRFLIFCWWVVVLPGAWAVEPRPTLEQLCKTHPTDKCAFKHGYTDFYETLFAPLRGKPARLLEIGVDQGHSLRLWEAYFSEAKIFALDIEPKTQFDGPRVATMVADQGSREDLAKALGRFGGGFDVVIDDGGHRMDQQQISFAVLFPALKKGGIYILEDVHTSFPAHYQGYGVDAGGGNSTYAMIDRFLRTGQIRSRYLRSAESRFLSENIAQCTYWFRPGPLHSSAFICRRK
jgi:hypothetical protein